MRGNSGTQGNRSVVGRHPFLFITIAFIMGVFVGVASYLSMEVHHQPIAEKPNQTSQLPSKIVRPSTAHQKGIDATPRAACALRPPEQQWPRACGSNASSAMARVPALVRMRQQQRRSAAASSGYAELVDGVHCRVAQLYDGMPAELHAATTTSKLCRKEVVRQHSVRIPLYSEADDNGVTLANANLSNETWPPRFTAIDAIDVLDPPFRFHIYDVPDEFIQDAVAELYRYWNDSYCNRMEPKTNYTMLHWKHALSLFTVDVHMTRFLRNHPAHTEDPAEADVFIIPMMTHAYHCSALSHLMKKLLKYICSLPYYRMYNNHDHYVFWWRWGLHHRVVAEYWKTVERYLPNVNLISYDFLERMGRNAFQDFSLSLKPNFLKSMLSIIVPYPDTSPALREPVPNHLLHADRHIFFFFSGTHTIGGIRRWIRRTCQEHEEDCVFEGFAKSEVDPKRLSVPTSYPERMRNSLFCGHAAGDALSSRRPTSAVLAGCIPVIICDLCVLPWENILDWSSFAVFVREDDVIAGKLFPILRNISSERIRELQRGVRAVRSHFVYTLPESAVDVGTGWLKEMKEGAPPPPPYTRASGIVPGDALDTLVGELALRGSVLREYKRWWIFNYRLSEELDDYPIIPPAVKKYMMDENAPGAREFNTV